MYQIIEHNKFLINNSPYNQNHFFPDDKAKLYYTLRNDLILLKVRKNKKIIKQILVF